MADKLTSAQENLMRLINDKGIAQMVGSTLAEIAVELMDAKQEAAHWKQSFETVKDEIKVLAGVALRQQHTHRLVITKAELQNMPANTELHVATPEPGVRVYELRQRIPSAVSPLHGPN
jgi:hypothetical protein